MELVTTFFEREVRGFFLAVFFWLPPKPLPEEEIYILKGGLIYYEPFSNRHLIP